MHVGPDFVPWLSKQVSTWADRYGCDARRAFPAWCLNFLFELEDDDAFNQTDTLTQGDAGLDGWYYDKEEGVFHLIQAKYLDDPLAGKVQRSDLDALVPAALLLRDPAAIEQGPHGSKLTNIALELKEAMLDDVSVSLDFLVAGGISTNAEEQLRQAVTELGDNYTVSFYDTGDLYATKLADDPISDLRGQQVDFLVSGDGEYFIREDLSLEGVQQAAVVALDGRSLGDAVEQRGAGLFHSNVRYYLRRSNRVNKSMLQTLDDEKGQRAFWLYNNGITIVAEEYSFIEDNGKSILRASNPQIVNGAQTSSVLRERRASIAPGDVSVQARIIAVTGDSAGRQALEKISEFTNSQSPVRPSDLRSNDRRHKTLQTAFAMLDKPVFYERRRGEWMSLSPADKARYDSRVAKEDIGQRFLAFSGKPAESVAKKDSIFHELESEAFDTNVSAYVYLLADTLYRQADHLLNKSNTEEMLGLVPGFATLVATEPTATTQLDALRPVRKLVCAHATALARDVLRSRYHEVGEMRAKALRQRLENAEDPTSAFVWRQVFKAFRFWLTSQPDKSALKSTLQKGEAYTQIQGTLLDVLADANMNELAAV